MCASRARCCRAVGERGHGGRATAARLRERERPPRRLVRVPDLTAPSRPLPVATPASASCGGAARPPRGRRPRRRRGREGVEHDGAPVYVRKEIVHNKFVVETLSERGAIFVDETDEVPEGARVVFSAHGVSPAVRGRATSEHDRRHVPLVTKVHKEAVRFAKDDYEIPPRPARATRRSRAPRAGAPTTCRSSTRPTTWTTSWSATRTRSCGSPRGRSVDETMETVRRLREKFPTLQDPAERRHLLRDAEPPGRGQEACSRRGRGHRGRLGELVQLRAPRRRSRSRRGPGRRTAFDHAKEIDPAWLDGATTVGVTSGASVPEILVDDVLAYLAAAAVRRGRGGPHGDGGPSRRCRAELRADLKGSTAGRRAHRGGRTLRPARPNRPRRSLPAAVGPGERSGARPAGRRLPPRLVAVVGARRSRPRTR